MNPASFDYLGIVPHTDLAATHKDMSFPQPTTSRQYPQLSIPTRSRNRISKLPSPQRRSCRKMASASDESGRTVFVNQALQQQKQQQYRHWNSHFSTGEFHHRQQRQTAPSTSCRPSSWHCPTLEPFQYMTPVSTISAYPCNNSNFASHNITNTANINNACSVSYSTASISPKISSSPLLSPACTTTTDSLLSHDFGSPLQLYSTPATFESQYPLADEPWMLDSLPQNNYFVHSPLSRDEHDYFQWNINTPGNYFLENCSLSSPPTPNDTVQSRLSGQPLMAEKCAPNYGLAKNQSGEELIGMGLYDCPESQKSPLFHHPSLEHMTKVQGIKFVQCLATEAQGKGLKLEETFTPTLSDDDSVTDDGNI